MRSPADNHGPRLVAGVRVLSLGALALASASAVEYYGRAHAFCAAGSGCDAVRASTLGRTIGQALPAIGLLGFAFVLGASLARHAVIRRLSWVAAVTGGVVGLGLLLAQALAIGAFCSLCTGIDLAAIAAA